MLQSFKRFALGLQLGAVASIIAHAMILALFVVDLPLTLPKLPETAAIEVELERPEEKKPPEPQQKPKPPAEKPAEKPPEKPPEPDKSAKAEPPKAKPPEVLRPVVKFGEKDAGPDKPDAGDAAREANATSTPPPKEPQPKPEPPAPALSSVPAQVPDPQALAVPAQKPPESAKPAKQMPSKSANKAPETTTAMGDVPRGIRAGQLCATELRRRLTNANPPYWPDLLPAYRLDKGTVMQVRKGAFRANSRWYNLEFRCEIDETATSVVSLEFDVGAPVPRSEWKSRGFPAL
jgi:hypothetical protein